VKTNGLAMTARKIVKTKELQIKIVILKELRVEPRDWSYYL